MTPLESVFMLELSGAIDRAAMNEVLASRDLTCVTAASHSTNEHLCDVT